MAATFAQAGAPAQQGPDGSSYAAPHPGNTVCQAVGAASVNGALPVDAQGHAYQAVRITVSTPTWFQFCSSGADVIVANTAPAFLIQPGAPADYGVPNAPGTAVPVGFFAQIQVVAGGFISVVGLF